MPIFKTQVDQELINAYLSKYCNPADDIDYQINHRITDDFIQKNERLLRFICVTSFQLSLEQAKKIVEEN